MSVTIKATKLSLTPEIWYTEDGVKIYMYSISQLEVIREKSREEWYASRHSLNNKQSAWTDGIGKTPISAIKKRNIL